MIQSSANIQGTETYASRFPGALQANHFRKLNDLFLSSVGLGTYLGEMDEATDKASYEALAACVSRGVNMIDSAINYRGQLSERVIGRALGDLIRDERLRREEVFLSTKGGFIPFGSDEPGNPAEYVTQHFIRTGILKSEDIVQGCHAMTPKYLEDQLERSLRNLGIDTIDLYYVHNPETQLEEISPALFDDRLTEAFAFLETKVSEGKMKMYGTATWNGYRVPTSQRGYLSLEKVLEAALRAGGKSHHFKAIQLPYNLAMPEAFVNQNQSWEGESMSPIEFARRSGLLVFASASLLQGRLAHGLPQKIRSFFSNCSSHSACALQFIRSTPGVTTALVGMKSLAHVSENLSVCEIPPLSEETFLNLFATRS